MKQQTIITIFLLSTLAAHAQIMHVAGVQRLTVPSEENTISQAVAISPQGDYLLLSTDTKKGLVKWDFESASATTLTLDEGAGSDVSISEDGRQVVYSQVSYKNKKRHQAVNAIDMSNGKRRSLVKATRHLQGYALDKATAAVMKDGKLSLHALEGKKTEFTRPVLSHFHLKLYVTKDGVTTQLAPNGVDENYIWSSLSPNGNRVLYYVSGHGTYVCDIDGTNIIPMGDLTAPRWWDDNTIVGMNEIDDEYSIIASSIVARTLDGIDQVLTGDDVIATYPLPSSQSGKIAFSTPDGKVYLITVE